MANPWLGIPLADYEGHMAAEGIGQACALRELFGRALEYARPASVALLGSAGGNGLDRIDPVVTRRVAGFDINPAYLDETRRRYAASLPHLELHAVDLASGSADTPPFALVHAALLFEHTGLAGGLENALSLVAPAGRLSVVLQLPSRETSGVGPSPFPSLQALAPGFQLIDPSRFRGAVETCGFRLEHEEWCPLPAGKVFWHGIFARAARAPLCWNSMRVSEIDTPALVVDLDVMERNLARVAGYAHDHGLRLRPHTKTHKSLRLAGRQLASGAAGLTVAKVSEAEIMAAAEPPELLVAFPIVGRAKLERLMAVAGRVRVSVALDSVWAAQQLSEAARTAQVDVGVLAEFDAGLGRVGVAPGAPLVELAQSLSRLPRLRFEGIAFYPGHIRELDDAGLRALERLSELVGGAVRDLERAGLAPAIVSGGSTPTLFHSHRITGLNEIRPGTYVFNDINTVRSGACGLEDCAATIVATVVSTARPGQMILDGGSKTFSSDRPAAPGEPTFGYVLEAPAARFHKMNEEHGFVDLAGAGREFQPGDRVRVIPNHICTAVNLHERVYGVRGDQVEEVWTVDARGKLQ